jgi:8-oxo-dGTP pyrophosphatase MutT (NUDIX family)
LIEGLLGSLRAACNFRAQGFARFDIGLEPIGWIRRERTALLRSWPDVFEVSPGRVRLRPATEEELNATLARVADGLAREGVIHGWRDETCAVRAEAGGGALFHIERAAMRFFGLTSSSAHLNGFVLRNAEPSIWIARRAATKSIDPGMLDNLVAGGVPSGEDAWQTLLRECGEEAGIPAALAGKARPAGVLRVRREVPEGLHCEILHIHDLELPAEFVPRNTDGEVSEFLPLDAQKLMGRIAGGEMTVEAALVAADFVLRQGLLQDEAGAIAGAVEACRYATPA